MALPPDGGIISPVSVLYDSSGNPVTVTGGRIEVISRVQDSSGGTITAAAGKLQANISDGSGNAITSTAGRLDSLSRIQGSGGETITPVGGRIDTLSRTQDGSGNAITSTTGRLDTKAWVADSTGGAITAVAGKLQANISDGSGNAITSTGGRIDAVARIQGTGGETITPVGGRVDTLSRTQDGSGNAIGSTNSRLNTIAQVADTQHRAIGMNTDAFSRLRVSEPWTIFDAKQVTVDPVLFFTEFTATGGTVAYNQARSSALLSCTSSVGSTAVKQTKRYFNYQPGKSFELFITFVMTNGGVANTIKRAGYFDNNNGLFFELNGVTAGFTIRSNTTGVIVDNNVPQANWNVDKLDGNGPSGISANWSKCQILHIDFEWLGVGVVRMGFVIDGRILICHEFRNTNNLDVVYMRTPNLPVRWEIVGNGAASSVEEICCSVASEGGQQLVGQTRSVDRGLSGKVANATLEQVIAIRLKSTNNRATILPSSVSLATTTTANTYWQLVLNPAVTGAASWTSVANSAVEYDVNLTVAASRTVSGGTVLASGYFASALDSARIELSNVLTIASDYAGTSDILVLACQPLAAQNETYYGSISWTEPT